MSGVEDVGRCRRVANVGAERHATGAPAPDAKHRSCADGSAKATHPPTRRRSSAMSLPWCSTSWTAC
jgi:hypothetical protein